MLFKPMWTSYDGSFLSTRLEGTEQCYRLADVSLFGAFPLRKSDVYAGIISDDIVLQVGRKDDYKIFFYSPGGTGGVLNSELRTQRMNRRMLAKHGRMSPFRLCLASLLGVEEQDRPVFESRIPQYMVMMFGMRDSKGFFDEDIASANSARSDSAKRGREMLDECLGDSGEKVIYTADNSGSIVEEHKFA